MLHSRTRVRPSQQRRWPPALVAVVATAILTLLTAACGSSKSPDVAHLGASTTQSRTPGTSSERSTYDQALAYAGCIRKHGVPLWPDPERGGVFDKSKLTPRQLGVSTLRTGTAERACKNLLPTYSPTQQSHVLAQALTFSQCMRAHGATDFPDPETNGAIRIPHAMENSPAYLAALNLCVRKYGVPPPPSPAGGGQS